jgi:hypothetical protein
MNDLPNILGMSKIQIENFTNKIAKTPDGCWLWLGAKTNLGYGKLGLKGKTLLAHRVSYQLFRGEIPEGMKLDHTCKKRSCVNPYQLDVVTQKENLLRGETINASNAQKTHCPKGHPYDEANTWIGSKKNGVQYRSCILCNKAKGKSRYRNQQASSERVTNFIMAKAS